MGCLKPIPLNASMHRDRKYVVKLLLLSNEDVEEDVGDRHHYILIRDLGTLFSSSTNAQHKIFLCPLSHCHIGEPYSRLRQAWGTGSILHLLWLKHFGIHQHGQSDESSIH